MASRTQIPRLALREAFVVWLAYVLVAVVFLLPLVARFQTHILADDVFIEPGRSDAYNFLWTYWWIQKAVVSGTNIYQCNWVLPPTGANLFFHTHVILPTLLTLPLGALFGPVVGYNCMILLLLAGAAWVYHAFLRCTFRLARVPAFIGGTMFGFSPYFVFKVHAHLNLVGGVFWCAALAVLVHAYTSGRFGWWSGALFAGGVWATFWTSFIEFFALTVVCALSVIVFEGMRLLRRERFGYSDRLRFFAMVFPGTISLLAFRYAPDVRAVDIAPFPNIQLSDLLIPARLSVLGGLRKISEFEYWGSHLPLVSVALAAIGIASMRHDSRASRDLVAIVCLAAIAVVITLNPLGLPLRLIRRLPLGTGFRVAGRFLPFVYFFALIPAAHGVDRILRLRTRHTRSLLLGAAAILAAFELFPAQLSPSPVKSFKLPDALVREGASGVFTLILPRGAYTNALDTYQVSMNVPVVQLSYLAREDTHAAETRRARFPALYPPPHKLSKRVLEQMRAAGVRYVLFEDRKGYEAARFRGELVVEHDGAILVRY